MNTEAAWAAGFFEMRLGVKENGKPPVIPGVEFEQVSGLAVRG